MRIVGRVKVVAVVAALGLAVAGCGQSGPNYPTGADQVVLRHTQLQGFLKPGEPASIVPQFTMYGDGRTIMVAPRSDGLMPELRELRLPQERVQQLVDHAIDADVLDEREAGTDIGPEATISLITLTAEERTGTAELGPDVGGDLGELRETMQEYAANPNAVRYPVSAIAVLATPIDGQPDRTWPLGPLRITQDRIDGAYCVIYRNDDVQTVTREAQRAEAGDTWYSGEATYVLSFRPLLPDEKGCDSLSTRARQQ
jgi:predicted small lipoprotein YifL